MRILLDDVPCEVSAATAAEALVEAAGVAESRGRLVVDVIVDGERLDEQDLASLDGRPAPPDEIRLWTTTIGMLLDETFTHAEAALGEAAQAQRDAADLLQTGDRATAMVKLDTALGLWSQINAAVTRAVDLAGWDTDSMDLGGPDLPTAVQGLAERLRDIRDAARLQDDVSLADCLQYEMPSTVEAWEALLPALARLAAEESPDDPGAPPGPEPEERV